MPLQVSVITPIRATKPIHLTWLNETIYSIASQTAIHDIEMVIVDDHSTINLSPVIEQWDRVNWLSAEKEGIMGVSAARNLAAEHAKAPLLLPLDGDDKFPINSVERFLYAWNQGGNKKGIVYSDLMMFGTDYQQYYKAPGYDFKLLLEHNFMIVGCLHKKSDWQKVGGWRLDMTSGYEDWEYWIALGELGVCGFHISEPLYWYRRHPFGRLAKIKSSGIGADIKAKMRDLHRESYNGRYTAMCCGAPVTTSRRPTVKQQLPTGDRVPVQYVGNQKGSISIAAPTGIMYYIAGSGAMVEDINGHTGVDKRDVPYLKSFNQGRNFRVLESPPPAPPVQPVAQQVAPKESDVHPILPTQNPAFSPENALDTHDPVVVDPGDYSVAGLKELDLTVQDAYAMLSLERDGKNRKSAIAYLESIVVES